MENTTNNINLTEISFPVYRLGEDKPTTIDGVSFLYTKAVIDDEEIESYRIVDDKTIPGDTLARRRLYLMKQGVKLKKLSRATFFLSDFIKLATKKLWFIDSHGKIFKYQKTKHVKLVFKKITKIIQIPTGGAIIEVEGMSTRFKTLYSPDILNKYAGLLQDGMTYIFYGTYPEKLKDTRRLI